jgi:uncharacterized protein (TIGR03435 family)
MLEDANGTRKIQYGEIVRPSGDKAAMLSIADGSRVEASPKSEFSLERAEGGGTKIRLNRGGVTVVAAVTEVRVQQGAIEMRLRPGEQVTSTPAPTLAPPKQKLAFEPVSIRPSGTVVAAPAPGARGGGDANSRPNKEGCSFGSMGWTVQLDPGRLAITRSTLFHLIAWAYPVGGVPAKNAISACSQAGGMGLISGGPEWIKTDLWDIQAGIPEGVLSGKPSPVDPKIQEMLQTLLVERTKLTLHRETREMSVYVLTQAQGGAKFNGMRPRPPGRRLMIQDADGNVVEATPEQETAWFAGLRGFTIVRGRFDAAKTTMSDLAEEIASSRNRPVFDRTGLTGAFDFHLDLQAPAAEGTPPANRVQIDLPTALRTIGLQLEESMAPVDVWVIDHVEKPSEN